MHHWLEEQNVQSRANTSSACLFAQVINDNDWNQFRSGTSELSFSQVVSFVLAFFLFIKFFFFSFFHSSLILIFFFRSHIHSFSQLLSFVLCSFLFSKVLSFVPMLFFSCFFFRSHVLSFSCSFLSSSFFHSHVLYFISKSIYFSLSQILPFKFFLSS